MPSFLLWGVKPDLMLLFVASWGLTRGVRDGVAWGFAGGVMLDLVSGAPFGGHTIALSLASAVAGLGATNLLRLGLGLPLAIVVASTIVYDLALAAFLGISGRAVNWLDLMMRVVLPSILLNLLAMPLVFWIVRALHRFTRPVRIEWE